MKIINLCDRFNLKDRKSESKLKVPFLINLLLFLQVDYSPWWGLVRRFWKLNYICAEVDCKWVISVVLMKDIQRVELLFKLGFRWCRNTVMSD